MAKEKKPVKLVLVDRAYNELGVTPIAPWTSCDICDYLNQGIAYVQGDCIYKRGFPPDGKASLMGQIIERITVLPNALWTVAKEVKKEPRRKPIGPKTFRLVARNRAAGEMHIIAAESWHESTICLLLNMGIAQVEAGGGSILKNNGVSVKPQWSTIAKVVYRHQTALHYFWEIEADNTRPKKRTAALLPG